MRLSEKTMMPVWINALFARRGRTAPDRIIGFFAEKVKPHGAPAAPLWGAARKYIFKIGFLPEKNGKARPAFVT